MTQTLSLDLIDPDRVQAIVEECSSASMTFFRADDTIVDNKLDRGFDPVTAADRLVEQLLRERLSDLVGDLPVIGEEQGTTGDPSKGLAWIIDPIDGTRAFISGQPQWGTLLGLLLDGSPVGGWMHLPVLGETYWAMGEASGATLLSNREPGASSCTEIADATLVSTHPSMFEDELADRFWALERSVKLSRFGGDCHNYALLANGDLDLVVENQMQTYDILPLVPIITEAGAVVTDANGEPPLNGGTIVAAATPELHAAALSAMTS